jgi:hypothetical protein
VFGTKGKNGLSIVVPKSSGLILSPRTVAAIPAVSVSASSAVLSEFVAFMMGFAPFFAAQNQ